MNESVKPYQSIPARSSRGAARGLAQLPREDRVLVVQRLVAARAQDRLAQPLQSEHEQERADDEPKRVQRHERQSRPERRDDHRQGQALPLRRRSATSASRA